MTQSSCSNDTRRHHKSSKSRTLSTIPNRGSREGSCSSVHQGVLGTVGGTLSPETPCVDPPAVRTHDHSLCEPGDLVFPPDPYVQLWLRQPPPCGTDLRKQTPRRKKTMAPHFNETIVFPISPRISDLMHTELSVTVFDHVAIASDSAIGQVREVLFTSTFRDVVRGVSLPRDLIGRQ